jgi:hypothetical protein
MIERNFAQGRLNSRPGIGVWQPREVIIDSVTELSGFEYFQSNIEQWVLVKKDICAVRYMGEKKAFSTGRLISSPLRCRMVQMVRLPTTWNFPICYNRDPSGFHRTVDGEYGSRS